MRRIFSAIAFAAACAPLCAFAGGFEFPDNGTEALGRGGAFVAKADDGTALYYNVAGLARQRGTRVTIDANLILHDTAFTRDGSYAGDPSATRPYAGQPYPTIHDGESLFLAPMLALSSDFGYFQHWTFGFGLYGPSSVGKHNYGVNTAGSETATVKVNGVDAPAPSRYDIARTNLLIILPTFAAAWSPLPFLDVGAAFQLVWAHFDLANANFTPLGRATCVGSPEFEGCDAYGGLTASGFGYGFLLSLLAHPTDWFDVGFQYRPQVAVHTHGTLHAVPPPAAPTMFPDAAATFDTQLPAFIRIGFRAAMHYPDGTERGDIELDGVWENWAAEAADHLQAKSDQQFLWRQGDDAVPTINVDVLHNYRDTFGFRLGGAYNIRVSDRMRISPRAGLFYDSAATLPRDTRLDFSTDWKVGATVGVGFKVRGFTINLAYAFIYSPTRVVTDSEVSAVSATNGTVYAPSDPRLYVGNGTYKPSLQILSVGVTVNIPEFKKPTLYPH